MGHHANYRIGKYDVIFNVHYGYNGEEYVGYAVYKNCRRLIWSDNGNYRPNLDGATKAVDHYLAMLEQRGCWVRKGE